MKPIYPHIEIPTKYEQFLTVTTEGHVPTCQDCEVLGTKPFDPENGGLGQLHVRATGSRFNRKLFDYPIMASTGRIEGWTNNKVLWSFSSRSDHRFVDPHPPLLWIIADYYGAVQESYWGDHRDLPSGFRILLEGPGSTHRKVQKIEPPTKAKKKLATDASK